MEKEIKVGSLKAGMEIRLSGEVWAKISEVKRSTSFDGHSRRPILRIKFDRMYEWGALMPKYKTTGRGISFRYKTTIVRVRSES